MIRRLWAAHWNGAPKFLQPALAGWEPRRTFVVQLHRVVKTDRPGFDAEVLSSWEPVAGLTFDEAREMSHRLRSDNRWGGDDAWPHVTVVVSRLGNR